MTRGFLWGVRARPTRGPKPAMTLDRIVDAAIALADAEGLAAVSMQRVAVDLGFTKMALYRYLPGKAELVALMVEQAIGGPPSLDPTDWRTGLAAWSRRLLAGYLRHPWTLEATVGSRPLGPNELGWLEAAVALLDSTGLTGAERLDAVAVLAGHVRMIAQQATAAGTTGSAGPGPEAGTATPAGPPVEASMAAVIAEVLRDHADRFPALAGIMAATGEEGRDQAFDFGLAVILDGLESLVSRRGSAGRRAGG